MKRVLVVEDDATNARVLTDYLSAFGYQVSVARTGSEGLERARAERPDLCVVDVLLPHKSGFDLCRELRSGGEGATTPIILMSAVYAEFDPRAEFAQQRVAADDFLSKPFALSDLLARVRRLLGEAAPQGG